MMYDKKNKALDDLTVEIPDGSIYGILGSNGAGKSTLLRMICGIIKVNEGEIKIDGESVFDNPRAKSKICFVNDETVHLSAYTLKELRKIYKNYYVDFSDEIFDKLCGKLDLPKNKLLSEFSKGMKRQATVIIALSCMTKYIILDEAFDGLDPAMRKIIRTIIADEIVERNATMLISSHNIAEINEICDSAMLIHNGKLIFANDIDNVKSGFSKVQIAFKNKKVTREHIDGAGVEIMDFITFGSVAQVVVRGGEDEVLQKLEWLKPEVLEVVPLTLEEIFIYELEVREYGKEILENA